MYKFYLLLCLLLSNLLLALPQPTLHVCTVSNREHPHLDKLKESCDIHHINLIILGMGMPYNSNRDRLPLVLEYCNSLPDNDVFLFIDAWDALILQDKETILNKFQAYNQDMVFSGAAECRPDRTLSSKIASMNKLKYPCAGTYIGRVHAIRSLLQNVISIGYTISTYPKNDQHLFSHYMSKYPGKITIDNSLELFTITHSKKQYADFHINNGILTDLSTGTQPAIFHACGKHWDVYNKVYLLCIQQNNNK